MNELAETGVRLALTPRRSVLVAALALSGCVVPVDAGRVPSADFLATARQHVLEREYRASWSARGLQAPNRKQGLRTYFDSSGIEVVDRALDGATPLVAMRLARVGRGEAGEAITSGRLVSDRERVEIHRPGLVEWYENSPRGLEQGFTLAAAPEGLGPLVIDLAVRRAKASLEGEAIVLATPSGRRLRYDSLVARDAAGRALGARMELPAAGRIRLVVEDSGARYPVTVDPLLTGASDAKIESDQARSRLGVSVAPAGDVNGDGYDDVIVGADQYDSGETNEGAAFVFLGSASGIASGDPSSATGMLQSNQAGASLGSSVASAGDVNGDGYDDVLVGAVLYDAGDANEGAAFVFLGSASGIASGDPSTAATTLQGNQASAYLGGSVASAGDVNGDGYDDVLVGAYLYDSGEANEGAAFIFLGSASGIASGDPSTAATLLQSDQASSNLGFSVASAGDVNGDGHADVIVGTPYYDSGEANEGAAFVFLGSASGIASGNPSTAVALLQSDQVGARFGYSVASAGDVNGDGHADVIVGSIWYDSGDSDEGAAFVFLGSASGAASSAAAVLQSDQASALFGFSVASAGDSNGDGFSDVIVGAPYYASGEAGEGAAFVFLGGASGIGSGGPSTATATLQADQAGANFGYSAASAGDVNGDGHADVIAGARYYDSDASASDEGATFVFFGMANGIADGGPATAAAVLRSGQGGAALGFSVASAGDVNGDGFSDVIVGAPDFDSPESSEGAALVFLGSENGSSMADGDPSTAATIIQSNASGARLGWSVASAGDVNGDGLADVIVGAPTFHSGETLDGAALVLLGDANGMGDGDPSTAATLFQPNQSYAELGQSVASAGDVNGDGYADVIVGAPHYDSGETDEGAAFVFLGSANGVVGDDPFAAAAMLQSDQAGAKFGYSVASAGDVNGDGYADVIVGAPHYDSGETDEGAAFVLLGSASGIASGNPSMAATMLQSDQAGASLGGSVASAGDVNGDGHADVVVGAPAYDSGETDEGAAFVLLGSASGIASGNPSMAATMLQSDQPGGGLGFSVAPAGDVNGDGYADVVVGAPSYDAPEASEGAAFVFLGSASGISGVGPSSAATFLQSDQEDAYLGWSVASAGDVNGDGFADVIVGAPGQAGEGAALVLLGNGGQSGRPVLIRQGNNGDSFAPIEPWGESSSLTSFDVSMQASHPAGRGRVALEIEWCQPGIVFGHASCGSATTAFVAVAPPTPRITLTARASGLGPGTLHRWRARVLHADATGPTNSASHGPWRRLRAQVVEADVRTGRLDSDSDTVSDARDNCPYSANPGQEDSGGLGLGDVPDGIGDACQCGDVSGDGRVTIADTVMIQRSRLVPPTAALVKPELCDVGGSSGCSVADAVIIRRALLVPPTATVQQVCAPALP